MSYQFSLNPNVIIEFIIALIIYRLVIKGVVAVVLKYIMQETKAGKDISTNVRKSFKERLKEETEK